MAVGKDERLNEETEEDIKATLEAYERDQGPSEVVEEKKSKRKRKKKKNKNKKNKKKKEEKEAKSSKSASEIKKDETGNNLEINEQIGSETSNYISCDGSLDSSLYLSASALSLSEEDQSLNDDNNADQLPPLDDLRLNDDNNATDANQFSDDPNLNDDNNVNPDENECESHHSDHNNLEENDAKEHSPMDDVANENNVIPDDESESSKNSTIASSTGLAESHNSDHINLEGNTNTAERDQDNKYTDELFAEIKQVVFGIQDDSESDSEQGHGSPDQPIMNIHRYFGELPRYPPPVPANSPALQGGSLSHFSREVAMDPSTPYRNACLRGLMSQQSRRPLAAPSPIIARGRGYQQQREQPSLYKNANNKYR